jgi:hypothetical protein
MRGVMVRSVRRVARERRLCDRDRRDGENERTHEDSARFLARPAGAPDSSVNPARIGRDLAENKAIS